MIKASKVLYVEDELFLGKIVKESLQSRGFEVIMEEDGAKVMRVFENVKPDICVLDVMLPNKDGFTLAQEIRKHNANIPILFLTAKIQTEDVIKGFTFGGNDYLRKPFSMEELIVRLNNLLKTQNAIIQKAKNGEFAIGKFTFQFEKQKLLLNNKEQKLSFREAELLKFIYENRSRIIDRKEILTTIWGHDDFFNSRNLDVYISKIRNYLKEDAGIQMVTLKGVGFRFLVVD